LTTSYQSKEISVLNEIHRHLNLFIGLLIFIQGAFFGVLLNFEDLDLNKALIYLQQYSISKFIAASHHLSSLFFI